MKTVNKLTVLVSTVVVSIGAFIGCQSVNTSIETGWSSDGEWIAFGCKHLNEDNSHIFVSRPDGSSEFRLDLQGLSGRSPTWSPDGEWLVLSAEQTPVIRPVAQIYRIRPNGTDLQNLTNNNADNLRPQWSPDGEWIAFMMSEELGNYDIYLVDKNGNRTERLTENADVHRITWSPTGEEIAFANNSGIYRMDISEREQHLVLATPFIAGLAWSPNGEELAYIFSGEPPGTELRVVNLNSGEIQTLSNNGFHLHPVWISEDWIAFTFFTVPPTSVNSSQVYRLFLEEQRVEQLTNASCDVNSLSWFVDNEE